MSAATASAPLPSPASAAALDTLRPYVAGAAIVVGLVICVVLYYTLPDKAAKVLIDRGGLLYPFSVQNGMWIAFALGCGEVGLRFIVGNRELRQLRLHYLPEDARIILQAKDLGDVYKRLHEYPEYAQCFLPRLIDRVVLQFQASRSIEQAASLLNTSVEMFIHEVDLRYNMLRYLTWFIPSLGFIGTVIGIGHALAYAGEPGRFQQPTLLTEVTARLAVAFDGTLLALLMAAVLVFLQNVAQSREEQALNLAGQYCLDNLINRLYVAEKS